MFRRLRNAPDAQSPSSRRAWIEMSSPPPKTHCRRVALLAEGVDRNLTNGDRRVPDAWSPSSRRAWIEIYEEVARLIGEDVALLAEGVDRNRGWSSCQSKAHRRPPRGGRG